MADFTTDPILTDEFKIALIETCQKYQSDKNYVALIFKNCAAVLKEGGDQQSAINSLNLSINGLPTPSQTDRLTPKFYEVLALAFDAHRTQIRKPNKKGEKIPYFAHLLSVCSIVLNSGGSEDEAITALLHDILEDTVINPNVVFRLCGAKVFSAIEELTEDKGLEKTERKKQYALRIRLMSEIALAVSMADKLDNLTDYATTSQDWATDSVKAFYDLLLPAYKLRLDSDSNMYFRLKHFFSFSRMIAYYKELWGSDPFESSDNQESFALPVLSTPNVKWINGNLKVGDYIFPWSKIAVDLSYYEAQKVIHITSGEVMPYTFASKICRIKDDLATELYEFLQNQ